MWGGGAEDLLNAAFGKLGRALLVLRAHRIWLHPQQGFVLNFCRKCSLRFGNSGQAKVAHEVWTRDRQRVREDPALESGPGSWRNVIASLKRSPLPWKRSARAPPERAQSPLFVRMIHELCRKLLV